MRIFAKPFQVFADLKGAMRKDALVLSILAGVPLAQFVNGLGLSPGAPPPPPLPLSPPPSRTCLLPPSLSYVVLHLCFSISLSPCSSVFPSRYHRTRASLLSTSCV